MDLSLASAFSPGAMVGHLAYLLLVISMLMRTMVWLRLFVIASSITGILYFAIWLTDPVSTFWETLLITVNVVQLTLLWLANRRARFTDEERAFAERRLRGLAPAAQRRILDLGRWEDLGDGAVLTTEGVRPNHLTYVAEGRVAIDAGGARVATCGPGRYVGEMSVFDAGPASATATVEGRARVWRLPVAALDALSARQPAHAAVIEAGIARDMRRKILALNAAAG